MNASGLSNSIRLLKEPIACPQCGSTSRVGRGLCLNCLLQTGLGAETGNNETLDGVLAEIDVPDADWRLGNYQILEEIGRGGMGVIYRARQRHSRRIVALKRVLSYHADSHETLARFRREAEAAASLDHPNILPIYEVSESEDGLPFFSMKFAPGGSLLDAAPALRDEPRRSVALMAKVARAVQYAHVQGILHRDLKPGNVMLDGHGEPLVSDFGLAKWLDTTSDVTRTLTIFGTPGYIAPEQARGPAAQLKPAADVYSLGAILFDLFTGRPPFLGEHALAVIQQAAEKSAPKLRTLATALDRDLETICARCLEREPPTRYHSAGDLAEDLEHWLEGRPITARPVSAPVRVWRWSKRNPKLAGSIAACLLLGTIAGVLQVQNRMAAHSAAIAMHSVVVEPLLDLNTAQSDSKLSNTIATTLQAVLSKRGPARVTLVPVETSSAGARTALKGTKRVRDGKLRVSLRLINTSDGKVLYRKIIDDVPDLAVNTTAPLIGSSIYSILNLADLTSVESKEVDPAWRNQSTRELLITARAVMQRRTVLDMDRALELLEKAVKTEPNSALGFSYLAELQAARVATTGDSTFLAAAATSVRIALSLNPKIAETHEALCSVLFEQGRFRESLDEAFTAYELADGDDDRLPSRVAANLEVLGELDKAVAWYRLALGKGYRPGNNEYSLADCLVELTEDEEATAMYRRTSSLFPELPEGWIGACRLALLHRDAAGARNISSVNWPRYKEFLSSEQMAAQVEFFTRNFDGAAKLYEGLAAGNPDGGKEFYGAVSYKSALGRLRLAARDKKSGRRILQEALKQELETFRSAPQSPGIPYRIAAIQSSLGAVESAIENLRMAGTLGWVDYRSMELDPRFDTVSEDPRFRSIVQAIQTKVQNAKRNLSNHHSAK